MEIKMINLYATIKKVGAQMRTQADYERLRAVNIQAFLELRSQVAAEAAANGLTEERLNELLAHDDK